MNHFNWPKWKSDIPIYHSANWMNSMMKIGNFHHVEMNMIQLDIMLLFNLFHSPLHSLSLIPERYLNWTQQIESDNLFIWRIFMMESRQYSHCCWMERKRKWLMALLNGDDGIKWWKWLTAQIVGKWKVVEEGSRQ